MPSDVGTEADLGKTIGTERQHYRPYLDGLRTVAVYAVVAYHSGLGLFSGGFIGVDVFFVLSGFLVTGILMRDLVSSGRVRLQQFYSRRARRILPAAVVTLLVTAIVYTVVASPSESLAAVGGFRAAFVYIANWFFIRQATDYFAVNVNTNPVVHFWSLAVEEQFYLVWPIVLAGLFLITRRIGRWRWWVLRAAVAACVVASAVAALHIATTNLDRAYYGTDTRAYQLLAGAGLALTPQLLQLRRRSERVARWVSSLAFVGVLVLATSVVSVGPISRGVLAAGFVLVLLVALENARNGLVKRILSSAPFTYLGRISYGVYLWHWPVIVIASHGRSLSPVELFAIATPIATGLAALSFHLFEHPIRVSDLLDRFKGPIIVVGFATSILCGVVAIPAILNSRSGSVGALTATGPSPSGFTLLDWRVAQKDFPKRPDCFEKPVQQCTVVAGKGLRVVLMGDSNAWMWIPTFSEIAKERGWNFSATVFPACAWQQNLQIPQHQVSLCKANQDDWYKRVIPTLNPDLVILVDQRLDNPTYKYTFVANGKSLLPGKKNYESGLIDVSAASIRSLQRPGRNIVILQSIPQPKLGDNPLQCLSVGHSVASCAFTEPVKTTPLAQFLENEDRAPGIATIDVNRLICPRYPVCDAVLGNIIVWLDAGHVTATYARSLAPQMAKLFPPTTGGG